MSVKINTKKSVGSQQSFETGSKELLNILMNP